MSAGLAERALVFDCRGIELLGIISDPTQATHSTGVVIVVGGPQYRVGSHRQFTLLSRELADRGIASFRFDYHGIGDSAGLPTLGVNGVEDDIRCAIDTFLSHAPNVKSTVLWGLCGAASASALYAPSDPRVTGLVMLNPWVRTESGLAKARLRHYYLGQLADLAFWRRVLKGDVALATAIRAFARNVVAAAGSGHAPAEAPADPSPTGAPFQQVEQAHEQPLPERLLRCLQQTKLPALVILSGQDDLTANEFRQLTRDSRAWRRWISSPGVNLHEIEGSNHTFSRGDWRDRVAELTAGWVKSR